MIGRATAAVSVLNRLAVRARFLTLLQRFSRGLGVHVLKFHSRLQLLLLEREDCSLPCLRLLAVGDHMGHFLGDAFPGDALHLGGGRLRPRSPVVEGQCVATALEPEVIIDPRGPRIHHVRGAEAAVTVLPKPSIPWQSIPLPTDGGHTSPAVRTLIISGCGAGRDRPREAESAALPIAKWVRPRDMGARRDFVEESPRADRFGLVPAHPTLWPNRPIFRENRLRGV